MGTLAGNKATWGEDWGYGHAGYRHYGGTAGMAPNQEENEASLAESPDSSQGLMSGLLVCALFWLLMGAAAVAWWLSRP